jgi:hypothetical protein
MAALSGIVGWALFRRAPNVAHIVAVAIFGAIGAVRGEKTRRDARDWTARAGELYETPPDLTHEFADAMPKTFDPRADRTDWPFPRA